MKYVPAVLMCLVLAGCNDEEGFSAECEDAWSRMVASSDGMIEAAPPLEGDMTVSQVRWASGMVFYSGFMSAGVDGWDRLPADKQGLLKASVQTVECYWPSGSVIAPDGRDMAAQVNGIFPEEMRQKAKVFVETIE